jgi:hypothetical protein
MTKLHSAVDQRGSRATDWRAARSRWESRTSDAAPTCPAMIIASAIIPRRPRDWPYEFGFARLNLTHCAAIVVLETRDVPKRSH